MFDPNAERVALQRLELMAHGTREEFEELIHPEFLNHEAKDEPPSARQPHGPAAAYAVAVWLRSAYSDLRWDVNDVVAERDLVVVHCTMKGRHTGAFVAYDVRAEVDEVFPPTGREFASTQTHWCRVTDGKLAEHWANRDDLGLAKECGWVPPSPGYLLRMAVAKRRARKAVHPWD
jgi:predicted ester cyclase